jgi:lysophospholipase
VIQHSGGGTSPHGIARSCSIGLALALALASCRSDPDYKKQDPVDLDRAPGPTATDFSSETDLAQRYTKQIVPFFEAGVAAGFKGVGQVDVRYHAFPVSPERGAIVLLPGRAEPVRKYAEVIVDLTSQGYSVFAIDHRGQGESQRLTSDRQLGYVEYFQDYVDDLHQFVQTIVRPAEHPNLFLLGEAMGGGIAVLYLDEHPTVFDAVTLVAPLIDLASGLPESFAWTWSAGSCSRSDGKSFAPGQSKFDAAARFEDSDNDLTRSKVRFDLYHDMLRARPELQLGGASDRWMCEAVAATSLMQTVGIYSRVRTLMFQAGHDEVANPDGQNGYCRDAAACQKVVLKDAYHEILHDRDAIKNDALAKLVRYFRTFEK